jgi:hypothetical protein
MAFYATTDIQGYLLAADGTPTLYNLARQEAVHLPSTRLYSPTRVSISDPSKESVWKVLVAPRDIRDVNSREEIYVDKFIPVKEIASFKDAALSYNMSAERITSYLKTVPRQASPEADYVPPSPCYWGIEYYDDRIQRKSVPDPVANQS